MKVKNWMITDVVVAFPDDTVEKAIQLMKKHSIRHLPVVDRDREKLIGLVTESELRAYLNPEKLKLSLKEVMILNPITVDPDTYIDEAAKLIYKYKIGGLPVVSQGKLVGIITVTDILESFIELMGILRASSRLDVIPKNGNLDDVLETIRKNGGKVISIGMDVNFEGERVYFIRLEKISLDKIASELEVAGHKIISIID